MHIFREVAGEFERPVILFSGGKDSIVMLHLALQGVRARAGAVHAAARRHRPQLPRGARVPRRSRRAARPAAASSPPCRTTSTPAGCASAPTAPATRCRPCRCSTPSRRASSTPSSAAAAATRRRPAPRSGSSPCATSSAPWDPRRQRPELWDLYNGRHAPGEHVRVFPLSNWTELDVWQYIEREGIELPEIYYAHERDGLPARRHVARPPASGAAPSRASPSRRGACATAPSATCPAPAPSTPTPPTWPP